MKSMARTFVLPLWLVVVVSLCGCSEQGSGSDGDGGDGGSAAAGGAAGGASGLSGSGAGGPAGVGGSGAGSSGSTAGEGGSSGSPAGSGGSAAGESGQGAGQGGSEAGEGGSGGTAGNGGSGGASGSGGAPPVPCDDTCHFVREGAGGNQDGSDWTDAFTQLPDTLQRGHRYFVADGDYPEYTFDDPADGDALITIVKATGDDHGTDAGWAGEHGDGRARFGPLAFTQPYYLFDGAVAGGFEAVAGYQGSAVEIDTDHVTLRAVDVNGDFGADAGGYHDRGACTGLSISGSYVAIESCEIHAAADDGVSISGSDHVEFRGNTVHALHACGTDGGCGPCYNGHSDGIETYNVKSSAFVGNFIHDVNSTATFFFGNWADTLGNGPSEYCEDILLANNIFYAPEVGLVAYIQDVVGIRVFHNVFWGLRQGGYGGLSVGPNVTDLWLYNNIILSINTAHTGGGFDSAQHHSDYNLYGVSLGQWTDGPNARVAADPGFVNIPDMSGPAVSDPQPGDFALTDSSPAFNAGFSGDASLVLPADDFFGTSRDSSPDMGAVERQ